MRKVPEPFDLRGLVRNVINGSSLRGPREIAEKVGEMIPPEKVREALGQTLPDFVRHILVNERQSAGHVTEVGTATRNSARSSKVRAVREQWRKVLVGQVHVGHGAWKQLAECTYDEVMYLAAERVEVARRTAAVGEMYAQLAAAMKKRRVTVVSALPEAMLADLLSVEDVAA